MRRLAWQTALIIAAYYVVPLQEDQPGWVQALRVGCVLAGLALVGWSVAREVAKQAAGDEGGLTPAGLALITVAGVVLFALADYNVAYWRQGEFVGLETRTDALYFAVSTLTTVGFGDVHAQGQVARGLVLVQMAFNIIVLATAATLVAGKIKAGQARRRAR
ncbi:potassium channel family protein [Nonomuraea sp. C10]|uniref:potassium channel family protein n=1 Tax=Nonomuraea sp. C10 TaxID=2600577 RepID=UPI0011CD40C4|nr:potassium channel family protein [Nonomuraea sp. C10]TXK42580.1 two pore domain potassium channel family protein [Nonomuraea sp. C10]